MGIHCERPPPPSPFFSVTRGGGVLAHTRSLLSKFKTFINSLQINTHFLHVADFYLPAVASGKCKAIIFGTPRTYFTTPGFPSAFRTLVCFMISRLAFH